MNDAPLFFLDPQSGFRRTYRQLATDAGIDRRMHWFDALAEPSNGADALPQETAVRLTSTSVCGSTLTGASDAPRSYGVFLGIVSALANGSELELKADLETRRLMAPALSGVRPYPLVPRDPPGGRVNDVGGGSPRKRAIKGNDLERLILDSPAKLGIRTSGTTGRPKLIWHSMPSLARAVKTGDRYATNVWGFAYEPTHFAGVQVFLQALANRNPIVWLFDLPPEVARAAIAECNITHLSATPTFFKMLCGGCWPIEGVRSVTLGGEAFDAAAFAEVQRAFPSARVRNVYASTELGSLLQADGDVFRVPSRLRHAMKVVGGELHVASDLLAESLHSGDDSFFPTGDQVEVLTDEPLSFRFVGRRSDWINVGGTKVNPHKIEAAASELEGVMAVRVFGQPNSVIGNLVACEIVLEEGASMTESDVKSQLSDRLSRYEMPQIVRFVSELTTTQTGKKQR